MGNIRHRDYLLKVHQSSRSRRSLAASKVDFPCKRPRALLEADQLQPDRALARAIQVDEHHALPAWEKWPRPTHDGRHTPLAIITATLLGSGALQRRRACGWATLIVLRCHWPSTSSPSHTGMVSLLPSLGVGGRSIGDLGGTAHPCRSLPLGPERRSGSFQVRSAARSLDSSAQAGQDKAILSCVTAKTALSTGGRCSMAARWLCALIGSWSRQRCSSSGSSTSHPLSRHRCFSSCGRGGAGLRLDGAGRPGAEG